MVGRDLGVAQPGGPGAGGAQQHQVGAQAVHLGGNAQRACGLQHRVGPGQRAGRLQALACRAQLRGQRGLGVCMAGAEGCGVGIEQQPRAHDGLALGRILHIGQAHAQAQAVQQLRAQLAFLGVHGAHQHEARRVAVRDAVALDHVDAAGGGIQQHIDQGIGQQVDLVHIEHAAMGARQQAGREFERMAGHGLAQVQRAGQMLQRGAQRQRDEGRGIDELGQRPRGRGLGRAARPLDQHAAQLRVDGGQQQRLAQQGLAGDGGKGKQRRQRGLGAAAQVRGGGHPRNPSRWFSCSSSRSSSCWR